jgi:hypothetical protein
MKTTLRNRIKGTMRKSGNKRYNGRFVTISKTCHEKKWHILITLQKMGNTPFLIKMEEPIYFASERDFRVQSLLWKNTSCYISNMFNTESNRKVHKLCCMTSSPTRTATLLRILHAVKAHTLPFTVRFQHRPQHFVYILTPGKHRLNDLPYEVRETTAKHLEFVVPTEVYLVLIGRLSLLANPIKRSHMRQDRDFAEANLLAL